MFYGLGLDAWLFFVVTVRFIVLNEGRLGVITESFV